MEPQLVAMAALTKSVRRAMREVRARASRPGWARKRA